MKPYIPELSEVRMVRRAPDGPLPLEPGDRAYLVETLAGMEREWGLAPFAGVSPEAWSMKRVIEQMIDWWRTLVPETDAQRDAYNRLPGAIRLIDTVATWAEERGRRR